MFALLGRYGRARSASLANGVRASVASSSRLLPIMCCGRFFSSSHNQDMLYVPFATDFQREHASIMFWVSKNTNLKEVNVNIRVLCSIALIDSCRGPIFPFGAFPLIVIFTSTTALQCRAIPTKMRQNERSVKCMAVKTTTTSWYG